MPVPTYVADKSRQGLALPREDRPGRIFMGNYLLHRLKEAGVGTVFGVPGDFTFGLCDLIDDCEGLDWAGNACELGAAYACDGYARLAGFGALLTTWGVGELSALNGVAGAYSERLPMLHIVGSPPRNQVEQRLPIHHSFADGDFSAFAKMSAPISCALETLDGTCQDADRIDHVLREALRHKRPAYLAVPTGVTFTSLISLERLLTPLEKTKEISYEVDSASAQDIFDAISRASNPVIIADVRVMRFGHTFALQRLLSVLQLPAFATPLSKGLIDESLDYFAGTYVGRSTLGSVQDQLSSADLVIRIGHLKTDTNTGGFTADIESSQLLDLDVDHVSFFGDGIRPVHDLHTVLSLVTVMAKTSSYQSRTPLSRMCEVSSDISCEQRNAPISQALLWQRITKFLRADDVVVCDTGTASFAITDVRLPARCRLLSQMLFNSIGWSVGACVGAAQALKEQNRENQHQVGRTIVIVGDGALQMTAQELCTLLRLKLQGVIIIVLNNSGYTIERALHGPDREYNSIVNWKYTSLLESFGAQPKMQRSLAASTVEELDRVFGDLEGEIESLPPVSLLEVRLDKLDAPRILAALGQVSQKRNAYGYAPEYNH